MDTSNNGSSANGGGKGESGYGCSTCRTRKHIKEENLASIKKNILAKLKFNHLPNMTNFPQVPEDVINYFYNSTNDRRYIRFTSNENSFLNGGHRSMDGHDGMQGDDPSVYGDGVDEEEEEEEFFSTTNRIYALPKLLKARHRDILEFTFQETENIAITNAIFYVNIRGEEWIKEHEPQLLHKYDTFSLQLNRVLRTTPRNTNNVTQRFLRADTDYTGTIPKGYGATIQLNVTDMVSDWFHNPNSPHEVVIRTPETWMRSLIAFETNSQNNYAPYIELFTKDMRKRRIKRTTFSYDCKDSDKENRCCRYPMRVNFRDFGWDWVIAPNIYEAFFCSGECSMGFLQKNPHTHIWQQLSTSATPCCSPTKMSPLSLLYFNDKHEIIYTTIPNMAVNRCSCT